MDESEFIQDLLECSVCLEQLTDQSKVLPCQHTFCRKCLAEIIQTRNELQCPECRIIVDITDLDELPSNILLIRLLEGLKQNMRIKNNKSAKTPNQTPLKQQLDFESKQNLMKISQKAMLKKHSSQDNQESLKNSAIKNKSVPNFDNRRPVILPNSIIAQQLYRHQYLVNSDKTLIKQPILNESAIFKNQVFAPPMVMNSMRQNNLNNINPTSSHNADLLTNDNQEFPTKIMTNARALYDSDFNFNWRIKKNDIIFIQEQINLHYYIAFFENTKGLVPVTFVELLPKLPNLPKQNPNCKNLSDPNSSETRLQNNLAFSLNNCNTNLDSTEQQIIQLNKLKKQVPYSNNSCYQDQAINLSNNLTCSDYHNQPIICKALYDFRVAEVNEKNCLSFKKNDLITLIRRVDDNWLEGSLKNNIGIFPISFVELLPIIKPSSRSSSQNDFTTPKQLSQVATTYQNYSQSSNPHWNSNSNLVNINHSRNNSLNQMSNLKLINSLKNENSNLINRNETLPVNNINSNSHLKNSSDSSQRTNALNKNMCSENNSFKTDTNSKNIFSKNSDSSLPLSFQLENANLNKSSVMISGSTSSNSYDNLLDIKVEHQRNLYIALYNYKPQKVDELELRKNEHYLVHEKCLDGWFKGSCTKSKKSGVFPGNYVQLINENSDSNYQNVIANRRSFGNLSNLKFDSSNNLFNERINDYNLNISRKVKNNVDSSFEISNNMSKMVINKKMSVDPLFNTQNHLTLSKSVEQINKKTNESKKINSSKKESSSNNSSTNNSPQWHQPKVAATRSCKNDQYLRNSNEPPYPLIFDNKELSDELRIEVRKTKYNTTHIIKEIINTPLKKEEKKVNLIKMFTGKRFNSKTDKSSNKNSSFSCDNPTFVDISPKN